MKYGHTTTWMSLRNMMLGERADRKDHSMRFYLGVTSRTAKSIYRVRR